MTHDTAIPFLRDTAEGTESLCLVKTLESVQSSVIQNSLKQLNPDAKRMNQADVAASNTTNSSFHKAEPQKVKMALETTQRVSCNSFL